MMWTSGFGQGIKFSNRVTATAKNATRQHSHDDPSNRKHWAPRLPDKQKSNPPILLCHIDNLNAAVYMELVVNVAHMLAHRKRADE